jgi:hypothetical protein
MLTTRARLDRAMGARLDRARRELRSAGRTPRVPPARAVFLLSPPARKNLRSEKVFPTSRSLARLQLFDTTDCMSQPPAPYDRQYNFTNYQTANPSAPLPGQKVDQELNAVRTAVNDTQSRLGEIQADDGTIRTSAMNIQVIAEEVEPLLTDAPILAVEQAGAQQVGLVNDAGDAKIADMLAILSSQNAQEAIAAKDAAESAADIAASSATLANGYAGSAQAYANTALQAKNSAIVHAQVAQEAAASIPLIVGPAGPQGIQGIQGVPGVAGQPGQPGQNGQAGPQGIQGPAGNAWVYRGEYNNGVTYQVNDYVTFAGSSYVMKVFIGAAGYYPSNNPGNWQLVASKGDTGNQGDPGPEGPVGMPGMEGPKGDKGDSVPTFVGEWSFTESYDNHEVVSYQGSSFIAVNNNSGSQPYLGSLDWQLIAQAGNPGDSGATGDPGPAGADGSGFPGYNYRGIFEAYGEYSTNDIVNFDGSSYVCKQYTGFGSDIFNDSYWQLFASKGAPGDPGGPQGPQGEPGPMGETGGQGEPGPAGPAGPAGPSIAEWVTETNYDVGAIVTYQTGAFICTDYVDEMYWTSPPTNPNNWAPLGASSFVRLSGEASQTIVGKITTMPLGGNAGLNIGIGGTSAAATTAGDLWITTGGANLNFRDGTGAWKVLASLQNGNVFSAVQAVDVTSTSTALRVTQKGTGNAIQVEDSTSPDSTAFVVDQFGKVGVGTAPDATAAIRVDANGISFNGLSFNPTSTTSHTGGSDTMDLLVTIGGVNYRIGLRPA